MPSAGQNNPDPARHIYGIDAIRFSSAVLVSAFHLTWHIPEAVHVMPFGWIGVQIFFVISGIVIANSAQSATPFRFAVSRFLRLYPVAWIAAAIICLLHAVTPAEAYKDLGIAVTLDPRALVNSLSLIGDSSIASAYWTLEIELAFYTLIFGTILLWGPAFIKKTGIILAFVSAPYLFLLFLHSAGVINLPWIDLGCGMKNMLLVRHGPYFALGIFVWATDKGLMRRQDWFVAALALFLAALEIYARAIEVAPRYATALDGTRIDGVLLAVSAGMTFLTAYIALAASVLFNDRLAPSIRVRGMLRAVGLATYPYYLLHETAGAFVVYWLLSIEVPYRVSLAMALIFTGVLAYSCFRWAEPWLRHHIKRRIEAWLLLQVQPSISASDG